MAPDIPDPDGQDQAEVFDEENITPDGREIATSDMQRDVPDVTAADDDADLDEALRDDPDFDPDEMDEAEYEEVVLREEDLDGPELATRGEADLVAEDDGSPADYEGEGFIAGGDEGEAPTPVDEAFAEPGEERSALNPRKP